MVLVISLVEMLIEHLLGNYTLLIRIADLTIRVDCKLFYACVLLTVVVSIVLHELAHGWAALWQGDATPRITGHMTVNPLTHMGGMSLALLAIVGIAWGMMPVNPSLFRSRYGDAMVSAAGPLMNVALALLGLTALAVWQKFGHPETVGWLGVLQVFLFVMGQYNIVLAMLNMLPIPPLDGSKVLGSFVPVYWRIINRLPNPEMLFFIFFIVLIVSGYNPFYEAGRVARAYLNLII